MKKYLDKVEEFSKAFNIPIKNTPSLNDNFGLRFKLMQEENEEYLEAAKNQDLVEIADALGDQLYIICGTILNHGMQHIIEDVFNEIHRSNMSKLDLSGNPIINGENGVLDITKPFGKVLKSNLFSEPNLKKFL